MEISEYNFDSLTRYISGHANDETSIQIKWTTNNNKNINVVVYNYSVEIWNFKEKYLTQHELKELVNKIEQILSEYNIKIAFKNIITVNNLEKEFKNSNRNKILDESKNNIDNNPQIKFNVKSDKDDKEIQKKENKNKNLIIVNKKTRAYKKNEVVGSVAKDNELFMESQVDNIFFKEIIGFRVNNKKYNAHICIDYWKEDEKIIVRIENEKNDKDNKLLFQTTLGEIFGKIKEDENNCGYN
jgi:hypothetical protein